MGKQIGVGGFPAIEDREGDAGMRSVQERYRKFACSYCLDGPERGWFWTENNGPIVPCPVCNHMSDREREYEKALRQRAISRARGLSHD